MSRCDGPVIHKNIFQGIVHMCTYRKDCKHHSQIDLILCTKFYNAASSLRFKDSIVSEDAGSNPGRMQRLYWQSDAHTIWLDLIRSRLDLIHIG
jgi:hypothetical protein